MLRGRSITKFLGSSLILEDVNIGVLPGRITGVISLESKETGALLRILGGHDSSHASGGIFLGDTPLPTRRTSGFHDFGIGLVPGVSRLVSHLPVLDHLVMGAWAGRHSPLGRISLSRSMAAFRPLLDRFRFDPSIYTPCGELTLEDRQKLSVIMGLLEGPRYLLLEDVTSALSLEMTTTLMEVLKEERDRGKGIAFVPDSPHQVFGLCDDVVVLRSGKAVFHRSVEDVDIEELFNIMNNSEYGIRQAIENKFHQFRDHIPRLGPLLERSLKVLGNFTGVFQAMTFHWEDGRLWVTPSKYWKKEATLPSSRTAKAILEALPAHRSEGRLQWNSLWWTWFRLSEGRKQAALLILETPSPQTPTFLQILSELRLAVFQLARRLKEEEEQKFREVQSIRLTKEMDIARHIQNSILPKSLTLPGYQVAALVETATEVGGDAYELLSTPLGNFIGIGDVSGHGLASGIMALIEMAAFHGVVQTHMRFVRNPEPHVIYDLVNKVLCELNRDRIGSDKFMTKVLMVENDGRFIHAGTHEIGLFFCARDRKVRHLEEMIDRTAFLGLSEHLESSGSLGQFEMEEGDTLLLYTDGLIEAKNAQGEQFDLRRVEEILTEFQNAPVRTLVNTLRERVFAFASEGDVKKNGGRLADDLTLLVLRRGPPPSPPESEEPDPLV